MMAASQNDTLNIIQRYAIGQRHSPGDVLAFTWLLRTTERRLQASAFENWFRVQGEGIKSILDIDTMLSLKLGNLPKQAEPVAKASDFRNMSQSQLGELYRSVCDKMGVSIPDDIGL